MCILYCIMLGAHKISSDSVSADDIMRAKLLHRLFVNVRDHCMFLHESAFRAMLMEWAMLDIKHGYNANRCPTYIETSDTIEYLMIVLKDYVERNYTTFNFDVYVSKSKMKELRKALNKMEHTMVKRGDFSFYTFPIVVLDKKIEEGVKLVVHDRIFMYKVPVMTYDNCIYRYDPEDCVGKLCRIVRGSKYMPECTIYGSTVIGATFEGMTPDVEEHVAQLYRELTVVISKFMLNRKYTNNMRICTMQRIFGWPTLHPCIADNTPITACDLCCDIWQNEECHMMLCCGGIVCTGHINQFIERNVCVCGCKIIDNPYEIV